MNDKIRAIKIQKLELIAREGKRTKYTYIHMQNISYILYIYIHISYIHKKTKYTYV